MLPCGVEDEFPEEEAREAVPVTPPDPTRLDRPRERYWLGPFFLFSKYHSGYPINLQHHNSLTLCLTADIGKCSFNTRKRIHT
ncbi:hypothetical protein ACOSP7_032117 [Xanthoceras sorbifolium]